METISQETRMISEKEFQHVAKDAQILGNETKEEIKKWGNPKTTDQWKEDNLKEFYYKLNKTNKML